jgi:hypothetical protein
MRSPGRARVCCESDHRCRDGRRVPERIAVVSGAAFSRASSSVTHGSVSRPCHRTHNQRAIAVIDATTATAATDSTTMFDVFLYSDRHEIRTERRSRARTSRWRPLAPNPCRTIQELRRRPGVQPMIAPNAHAGFQAARPLCPVCEG